jgi:hypothetical protein
MDAKGESDPTAGKHRTTVERKSERELVVTRTFNAPARIVLLSPPGVRVGLARRSSNWTSFSSP